MMKSTQKLKIKVLHILDSLNAGGIQAFIMSAFHKMSSECQFDFLLFGTYGKKDYYEDEAAALGSKIVHIHSRRENLWLNYKELDMFLKENVHRYTTVHYHASSATYFLPIRLAYKYRYPQIIMHSHNTHQGGAKFHIILHSINKNFIEKRADHMLACSELAAKWMYTTKAFNNKRYMIVNNGIETEKFRFDIISRNEIRKTLGIKDNQTVYGNVARFHKQKNHTFLLNIFRNIVQKDKDAVLLLIGDGTERKKIELLADKYKISRNIMFLGVRNDVNRLFSAMDDFIFPSLYEGLGIVLIEAQASGLPCYASADVIPQNVKITDLISFVSLGWGAEKWANIILHKANKLNGKDRILRYKEIRNLGYDINETVQILLGIYKRTL